MYLEEIKKQKSGDPLELWILASEKSPHALKVQNEILIEVKKQFNLVPS